MGRLIIASNRLPVNIIENDNSLEIVPSAGGLATGLKSYHKQNNSVWIGWPGIITDSTKKQKEVIKKLEPEFCSPIFLSEELVSNYYDGFSNATLWPLFHYFTQFTVFDEKYWDAYTEVNQLFAEAIIQESRKGDTVWIQDYQLLLVPQMLKEKRPDLHVGFFLHIPFPSYEVFRILPWRDEIISGLLGADLIGFHTYDYARHFISSVRRLKGCEVEFNKITHENRRVFVDVFPMGIDFQVFHDKAYETQTKPIQERSKEHRDLDKYLLETSDRKLMLSIDRLDYTKGIPNRLKAFKAFLERYPQYLEKVSLILLTVPSRTDVEEYQNLRKEVEVLVGSINGQYGTMQWSPIIFFYRSVPFDHLIELYTSSDVALLTPLRDGMNLVAKEYLATQINHKGVLILSEMAGASKELGEAISVNPNNINDMVEAIYKALTTPEKEQKEANISMRNRLKRYDIFAWANDFMKTLDKTRERLSEYQIKKLSPTVSQNLLTRINKAKQRVIFLDYDGTLQRFYEDPLEAKPDKPLYALLDKLEALPQTEIVLISGRSKETFNEWFGSKKYHLIAEHGAWVKQVNTEWIPKNVGNLEWKESIRHVLESYVDRTPGSLIEEKEFSLVWHYRKADIELGVLRALELKEDISSLIVNHNLEILEGSKVIEIKTIGINKGAAALEFLSQHEEVDCIMAIGDDWTDEFLFKKLPQEAITIKVGTNNTIARYYIDTYKDVRNFLQTITQ
ncbi:MAG: bifunctional alpha,alpha-trehalose-phosphate synthase (UDP-forming)/trehalose-phosphatase [Bacteroidales bacterium]|nr:bifunctional alpha,alpha-trehalose-phosphate synthase (UDP-forming)/trehalose-phosphatase [Bacteroidales bacterium]